MADSEPIVQVVEGDIDPSSIARQVYALIGLSLQERQERLDALQRQNPALHDRVADRLTDALRLRQALEQLSDDATGRSETTGVSDELVRINGYFCLEMISLGGQGDVYLANQVSTGQLVAIKVLRPAENKVKLSSRRFEREVDALAMLNRPGIVQIIDRGTTDDGQPYIVTNYIEGLHLDEYVEGWREEHADQPLLADDVLQIWFQIAEGVAAIHKADLVHRDIKPSNIIVSDNGRPHILDFGLAKNLLPDNITSLDVTTREAFIGTPKWASPEQATLGGQDVDARSDVYSLGLLLYYMISGRMPYDLSGNMQQILAAIATQQPMPLRQACKAKKDIRFVITNWLHVNRPSESPSYNLEKVLTKALAKNPDQRYQSVEDLVSDVKRCVANKTSLHAGTDQQILRRIGLGFIAICIASVGLAGWLLWPSNATERQMIDEGTSASDAPKPIRISLNRAKPAPLDESLPPEKRYLQKMSGARFFRGHSYLLIRGAWSWEEANQYAQSIGGHLFVPDDYQNEFPFLMSQIHRSGIRGRSRPFFWIGLKHSNSTGTVTWDNKPIVFSGWKIKTDLNKEEMQYAFGNSIKYRLTDAMDSKYGMLVEWPFVPAREDIGNGVPPKDAVIRGDYAYKLYTDMQYPPTLAIEECFKRGGCLVDIQSEEEEKFLVNLIAEKGLLHLGAWIGTVLSRGDQFDLITGRQATYTNIAESVDLTNKVRAYYFHLSEEGWLSWKGDSTDTLARPYICKWVLKN